MWLIARKVFNRGGSNPPPIANKIKMKKKRIYKGCELSSPTYRKVAAKMAKSTDEDIQPYKRKKWYYGKNTDN